MELVYKFLVFYAILLFICLACGFLAANEIWKRHGLLLDRDESKAYARELVREGHWAARLVLIIYPITFFWYVLPIAFYNRFVKKNTRVTISNFRGEENWP